MYPSGTTGMPGMSARARLDSCHESLARLISVVAPGARDLVAVMEAYFDESGSHDHAGVLCVAGYLYQKDDCLNLDWQWKEVLDQYDLPFFHMVDCAHGNKPFDKLCKRDRIIVATRMIELIKKYMSYGFSVTIDEDQYNSWRVEDYPLFPSAYSWCCYICTIAVAGWANEHQSDGEISYFFEAGHRDEAESNRVMKSILDIPAFRYRSHAFVKKIDARPIQSADILAWHAALFRKRLIKDASTRPRADFRSLVARDTVTFHGEKRMFDKIHAALLDYRNNPNRPLEDVGIWGK
jgi:Protein of unknown function (DUF3800)